MLTEYGAHKIVNAKLKENGIDKSIPPQMMYNYMSQKVKQNKKPLIKWDAESGVDVQDFNNWLDKYINKQLELLAAAKAETEVEVES